MWSSGMALYDTSPWRADALCVHSSLRHRGEQPSTQASGLDVVSPQLCPLLEVFKSVPLYLSQPCFLISRVIKLETGGRDDVETGVSLSAKPHTPQSFHFRKTGQPTPGSSSLGRATGPTALPAHMPIPSEHNPGRPPLQGGLAFPPPTWAAFTCSRPSYCGLPTHASD